MADDTNTTQPPQIKSRHRYPISEQTRNRLRQKRFELNLSFERLGKLLAVHWSTARKWEMGETHHYSAIHHEKLQAFIAGDYDHHFVDQRQVTPLDLLPDESAAGAQATHQRLDALLRRVARLYQLALPCPGLQAAILRQLDNLTDGILARLTSAAPDTPEAPEAETTPRG